MRRAISFVLTICMLVCMVPFALPSVFESFAGTYMITDMESGSVPLASEVYYKSDGNGSITATGASSENYDVYFDPAGNRLVLNGIALRRIVMLQENEANKDFTIEVHGENSVSFKTIAVGRAYMGTGTDGKLIVTGDGILDISLTSEAALGDRHEFAALQSTGDIVVGGDVTLKCTAAPDATVTAGSPSTVYGGLYSVNGSITIKDNASVEARGLYTISEDSAVHSYGVYANDGITVTDNATLKAYSGDVATTGSSVGCESIAIFAGTGDFTVGGNATVIAEGGNAIANGTVSASHAPVSAGVYAGGDVNVEGHLTATSGTARGFDVNSYNHGKTYGIFAGRELISDASSSSQGRNAVISATSIKVNSDVKLNNSEVNVNANFSNDLKNAFDVENRTLTATNSAINIMLTGVADRTNPYGLIAADIYLDNTSLDVEFDNFTAPQDIAGIKASSILQLSGQETDANIVYRSTCSLHDPTGIFAPGVTVSALDNAHLAINFEGQPRRITGMWVDRLNLQNANLDITATGSGSLITEGNVQGIYCSKVNIENSNTVIDFGSSLAGTDSRCIRAILGNANEDNVSIINSDVRLMPGAATGESIGIKAIGNVIISSGAIIGNAGNLTTKAIDVASADKLTIAEGLHWATAAGVATTNGAYTWSADDSLLIITTSAIVPSSGGSHHSGGGSGSAGGAGESVAAEGSKTTIKTDANGNLLSVEVAISEKAVADAMAKGAPMKLDTSVKTAASADKAVPVEIKVPASVTGNNPLTVELPVENMTEGTVAVIVYGDGSEEIVKTCVAGDEGLILTLEGSTTVKVVDNTKSFTDVAGSEWFAGNVAWAASREIMNGIGGGIFDAGSLTNRGMISQILFNLEGARATAAQTIIATERFGDVSSNNWFADSIGWLIANDIAQGQGSDFGAADPVTREQLAVMYYNYAIFKRFKMNERGDVAKFADSADVSSWAEEALSWAVGMGLIQGTLLDDGSIALDPQGSSTRAMVAAITQRFCEKLL
jgi:hypothetical protein